MLKLTMLSFVVGVSASAHTGFTLPTTGCPLAHCSIYAGNVDLAQAPPTTPTQRFDDTLTGSSVGLGCVTSSTIIACTYDNGPTVDGSGTPLCPSGSTDNPSDTLVIYNTSGTILYHSNCLFDSKAWESVPIISSAGDVFMSDDRYVARISPDPTTHLYPSPGGSTWCMDFTLGSSSTPAPSTCGSTGTYLTKPPGPSISPILLSNGKMIVFATSAPGYVFAFYADDGSFIASTQVTGTCSTGGATCPYETLNTPTASYDSSTNRFYLSMDAYHNFGGYHNVDGYGLLVALQVNTTPTPNTIDIEWSYPFNGPSGATPVVLPVSGGSDSAIYFDGHGNSDPLLYRITDNGGSYTANWSSGTLFASRIPASVTVDSAHNCVWAYGLDTTNLYCVDLGTSYALDYTIDTSRFSSGFPASAMTLSTTSGGAEILTLGLTVVRNPGNILAIDLAPDSPYFGSQYWIFGLPTSGEFAPTEFPIITYTSGSSSYQVIAFPSDQNRLYMYGN